MAMMVLRTCTQVEGGLPADVKSKMMFNVIVDFVVGLIPFFGDLGNVPLEMSVPGKEIGQLTLDI